MKKVLSIVLAIAMIATMSAVAFAAADPTGSVKEESAAAAGTAEFDVNATFAAAAHVDKYKVDVEWDTEGFTYTEAATVWDTEDHVWVETNAASWDGEGTITVANHSSEAISATPSWAAAADGVVMSFDKAFANIAACGVEEDAPEATFTAEITAGAIAADAKIGTITVTIAAEMV